MCSPSAQHAVRQAKRLAENLAATIHGRPVRPYKHKYAGSVASLGLYKGVAQIYGIKLRGFPAWFMHRTYHMSRIPSFNRKVRVVADWTLALLLKREVVSMGELHEPRDPFTGVTAPTVVDGGLEG
jgi:NADH dehydrogenase